MAHELVLASKAVVEVAVGPLVAGLVVRVMLERCLVRVMMN